MRIAVLVALLLAGCTKSNPNYCPPGAQDCPDFTPKPCTTSDSSCVCMNPPGICVECTAADERNCSGTKPQCGGDNRCRACRADDECDSNACLETGACAAASQVIYAAPAGVNTAGCGLAAGQNECSIAQALIEVGQRTIIRLAPGSYTVAGADGLDFNTKSATLIARGAIITRAPAGPLLTVRNGQSLKLVGGTLRGPNSADGVKCNTGGKLQIHEAIIEKMDESGLEVDGCDFTVARSVIRRNLQGGINMVNLARIATITNNYVYQNGQGLSSPVPGMTLKLAAGSKVEFNTVVDNTAAVNAASAGGIICEGQGYDAPYNLVYRNQGGLGGTVQVIGTCTFQGSYQQAAGALDENAVAFENPNDSQNPSYRLTATSPGEVKDRSVAGFSCKDLIDFEGDARPQPTGGTCDCGADELRAGQ